MIAPQRAKAVLRPLLAPLIAVGAVLLVLLIGYVAVGTYQNTSLIRHTQIDGTPTGKRIETLANQANSCLDPAGACYQESQAQRASGFGVIDRGGRANAAAAAACAARPDVHGYEAILTCMNTVLRASRPSATPSTSPTPTPAP